VEDNRGDIEDYRNRYGYDEKEAEAAYHLSRARSLIREMYVDEAGADALIAEVLGTTAGLPRTHAQMFLLSSVIPHFEALQNLLVRRSLTRQSPKGGAGGDRRARGQSSRTLVGHPQSCISIQPRIIPTTSRGDRPWPGAPGRGTTWFYPGSRK
jgi:hypothetical protein